MTELSASTGQSNYNSHFTLLEALDHYIANNGKDSRWNYRSRTNRKKDFSELNRIANKTGMKCEDFNVSIYRTFINSEGRNLALHRLPMHRISLFPDI